jgi:hypothetical protein
MANSFTMLMEDDGNEFNRRFTLPNQNGMSDFQLIEQRLVQQQQTRRFNGDIADLFLPRMIKAVIGMFGGEVASDNDSFDRPAPSDFGHPISSTYPKGPGGR